MATVVACLAVTTTGGSHNMVAIQHPDRDRDQNEVIGTSPFQVRSSPTRATRATRATHAVTARSASRTSATVRGTAAATWAAVT